MIFGGRWRWIVAQLGGAEEAHIICPEHDPSKLLPSDILRHRFTPPWVKRPQGDGRLARRRVRHSSLLQLLAARFG